MAAKLCLMASHGYPHGFVLQQEHNSMGIIKEEEEKRHLEQIESELDNVLENRYEVGAVALVGKTSKETITAADAIIDAIDLAEAELKRLAEHEEEKSRGSIADFNPNSLMNGLSPSDYVLRAVSSVQTNDLEQTLLALPFTDALKLVSYLKDWTLNPDKVKLVCKISLVLLQTHFNQLVSTPAARPLLTALKEILYPEIKERKDIIGFNLAAMEHLKQLMALRSDALFQDAKSKLHVIRAQHSKHLDALTGTGTGPREENKSKKYLI